MNLQFTGIWNVKGNSQEKWQVIYTNAMTKEEFDCGSTESDLQDVLGFVAEDGSQNDMVYINGDFYGQLV